MAQRVKGQETSIVIAGPEGTEDSIDAVQSLELAVQMEILREGYLGEVSDRRDDIFRGLRGRIEIHLQTEDYFRFVQRAKDRSQRRSPSAERFDILTSINFPEAGRARILLENCFFGEFPVSVGGREEYVSATVEFESQDGRFIL